MLKLLAFFLVIHSLLGSPTAATPKDSGSCDPGPAVLTVENDKITVTAVVQCGGGTAGVTWGTGSNGNDTSVTFRKSSQSSNVLPTTFLNVADTTSKTTGNQSYQLTLPISGGNATLGMAPCSNNCKEYP